MLNERDEILERAIDAAAKAATAYGNDSRALTAWTACHSLKRLRRPEVLAQLEADRLARAAA